MFSSTAFQRPSFFVNRRKFSFHVRNQPPYRIDDLDLSNLWLDLVRQDKVSASVPLLPDNGPMEFPTSSVKYGVRMVESASDGGTICQEYVMEEGLLPGDVSQHPTIRLINETLAQLQRQPEEGEEGSSSSSGGVTFLQAGGFIAQLQLVRTLRPLPSPGFSGAMTSVPPPYDPTTDSFVTGPLRLELRPLVGCLYLKNNIFLSPLHTPWDIFHNVSPADARGHFLLLPTLSETTNWRGQDFTAKDCYDMIHIAHAIDPPGSLFLGYNSVGAGASQNHIHCHAWPCPPVPLLNDVDDDRNGWNAYPVSKVTSIYDFCDVMNDLDNDSKGDDRVEVSYLKYPVFCVLLSASTCHLELLGKCLETVMACIDTAPHNIAFLNRPLNNCDTIAEYCCYVDIYVFARSKERSNILPTLKLGISEMMGVFHAQSDDELHTLATLVPREDETEENGGDRTHDHDHEHDNSADVVISGMERALADVSVSNEADLWERIKDELEHLLRS
jgi:hypothetical protein